MPPVRPPVKNAIGPDVEGTMEFDTITFFLTQRQYPNNARTYAYSNIFLKKDHQQARGTERSQSKNNNVY